jgi:hypothetical protein
MRLNRLLIKKRYYFFKIGLLRRLGNYSNIQAVISEASGKIKVLINKEGECFPSFGDSWIISLDKENKNSSFIEVRERVLIKDENMNLPTFVIGKKELPSEIAFKVIDELEECEEKKNKIIKQKEDALENYKKEVEEWSRKEIGKIKRPTLKI